MPQFQRVSPNLTPIPQPSGHAFILRRFDTGAVSLTTMFRAAFPNAPDYEEKQEVQWIKDNYDLTGNNGSSKDPHITRLAGTWVSPVVALELGKLYALGALITAVVEAQPDPNGSYRRSGKSAAAAANAHTPSSVPSPTLSSVTPSFAKPPSKSLPTPSPSTTFPHPPAKRRKESSPAPAPAPIQTSPSAAKVPLPRRSARTKSPAPRTIAPLTPVLKTPRVVKAARRKEALTPGGSDETAVDEEGELVEDDVAGSELRQQDIKEQKDLIEDLKAQREGALASGSSAGEEANEKKRVREDEEEGKLQFHFKEPEVGERAIATNNRVGRFRMEPRTKSFAWGVAAFAVGMGAV